MKKIETLEQRDKALKWMVEVANHPLDPVNKDPKTKQIYEITSARVQEFNDQLYAGKEYPPLNDAKDLIEKETKQDLSGWLDDE